MLEKLSKFFTNVKTIIGGVTFIIGGIVYAAVWASDVNKAVTKMEQIQVQFAEQDSKMFEFVMNLWRIDPSQSSKWKQFPQRPTLRENGDTLINTDWIEFENLERIIKYRLTDKKIGDSTVRTLLVDTLYEHGDSL